MSAVERIKLEMCEIEVEHRHKNWGRRNNSFLDKKKFPKNLCQFSVLKFAHMIGIWEFDIADYITRFLKLHSVEIGDVTQTRWRKSGESQRV